MTPLTVTNPADAVDRFVAAGRAELVDGCEVEASELEVENLVTGKREKSGPPAAELELGELDELERLPGPFKKVR